MENFLVPVWVFFLALGALILSSVLHSLIRLQTLPRSIPIPGSYNGDNTFRRAIAYIRTWWKGRSALRDGYLEVRQ